MRIGVKGRQDKILGIFAHGAACPLCVRIGLWRERSIQATALATTGIQGVIKSPGNTAESGGNVIEFGSRLSAVRGLNQARQNDEFFRYVRRLIQR